MAPSNAPAAQTGACAPLDAVAQPDPDGPPGQSPPIVLLFLGTRGTVRQLDKSWSSDGRANLAGPDVALDMRFSSHNQVRLMVVTSQRAALRQVRAQPPEAILVELDNRPHSREHFCSTLRRRVPDAAILAVAKKPPQGHFPFDGYLPLPFTPEQAESAAGMLPLRTSAQVLRCGPFELNVATRTVYTADGPHSLTPKLCALLQLFMNNRNRLVSRREIMEAIWETSYLDDTRTLDVHIRWLRESIEPDPYNPRFLTTTRGKGYTFFC